MKKSILFIGIILLWAVSSFAISTAALYSKGVNFYLQRDFKQAAFMWQSVLEQEPNNKKAQEYMEKAYNKYNSMQVYFYKGLKYYKENDCTNAIENFQQALIINPNYEKARHYLSLTYQNCHDTEKEITKANTALSNADYRSAVLLYKNLVQLNPDDDDLKFKLKKAENLLNEQDRIQAIQMHLEAAKEFSQKEKYDFSIPEWNKVLALESTNKIALDGLRKDQAAKKIQDKNKKIENLLSAGIDEYTQEHYLKAREKFKNVLFLDDNNNTALQYMEKIKNLLKAQENQRLALNEAEKHLNTGITFYNKEKYYDALDEFKVALSFETNNQKAKDYIEKTKEKIDELEKAEQARKEQQIQKLLEDAIVNYQLKQYKEAKELFFKILEIDPENEVAQQYLKLINETMRFLENSVVTHDSPYYYIYLKLMDAGKKAFDTKNYTLATEYFQQIIELFPLNKEANDYLLRAMYYTDKTKFDVILKKHINSGKSYLKKGQIQAAKAEFLIVKNLIPDYEGIDTLINSCVYKPKVDVALIKKQYNLGVLHYSKQEWQKAIDAWTQVIKMDKSPNSNPFYGKSVLSIRKAKRHLGQPTVSATATPKTGANAQQIRKHHYMGIAFYTDGKYEKAINEWKQVLKLDPNNIQAMQNIKKAKKRLKYSK